MYVVLIGLLLQASYGLPSRANLENPALSMPVPKQLQKDYDKLWLRFIDGREDKKVYADADKLLKKDKTFAPALIVQAYVSMSTGNNMEAERKLEQVVSADPKARLALYYLAELVFVRNDFVRAGELYGQLMTLVQPSPDLEMKRQKALLLALENLLQDATDAAQQNRLDDAEKIYRQAIRIAPEEAELHSQLGAVLLRQKKWDDAIGEFKRQIELGGSAVEAQRGMAEALTGIGRPDEANAILKSLDDSGQLSRQPEGNVADLENLGRWGNQIGRYREIAAAATITREQLAGLLVRFFPQLVEFKQKPQIVIDVPDSWAASEIQVVVALGLLDPMPNHTFQPGSTVSRGEFAQALARLANLLGMTAKDGAAAAASDMPQGAPLQQEVQMVLAHGLMALDDSGRFVPAASIRGQEAVDAVEKLLRLIR